MQAVSFAHCCPSEYISFFYFSLFLLFDFCVWQAYCGQGVEAGLLRNLEGPSSEAHNLGNRTHSFNQWLLHLFLSPPSPSPSLPLSFSSHPLFLFFSQSFFFSFFMVFIVSNHDITCHLNMGQRLHTCELKYTSLLFSLVCHVCYKDAERTNREQCRGILSNFPMKDIKWSYL